MASVQTKRTWNYIWRRLSQFALQRDETVENPFGGKASSFDESTYIYVDVTGDDKNFGTSNSPFRTIQAAIDYIAGFEINAPVYINVGAGVFSGFRIEGIRFGKTQSAEGAFLAIMGTVGPANLASGIQRGEITAIAPVNSTATSSFTIDSAGWTVDNLKGKFAFNETQGTIKYVPIISNTSDTVVFNDLLGSFNLLETVSIVEPLTIVTDNTFNAKVLTQGSDSTTPFEGQEGNAIIRIANCNGIDHTGTSDIARILISNLGVTSESSGVARIRVANSSVMFRTISTSGNGSGAHILETSGNLTILGWSSFGTGTAYQSPQSNNTNYRSRTNITSAFIERSGGIGFLGGGRVGLTDTYIKGCATAISMQDSRYSLLRFGIDSCFNAVYNEQGGASYNNLYRCEVTLDGGFFNECTNCVFLKGLHWMQAKFVGGANNTNAIVASQGARVGIRNDFNPGATNQITLDGVVSTFASMRAATPPVVNNLTYFSIVYASDQTQN